MKRDVHLEIQRGSACGACDVLDELGERGLLLISCRLSRARALNRPGKSQTQCMLRKPFSSDIVPT